MKGIAPLLIGLILVITAIGGLIVATPGLGASLASMISGPQLCSETPYDSNCMCPEGDQQLRAPALAGLTDQYFCEKIVKFLDPADPLWTNEAKAHASSMLASLFPTCDMAQCNTHGATWQVGTGYMYPDTGIIAGRVVGLDCTDSHLFMFAQLEFDVETGAVEHATCGSYNDVVQTPETTPIEPAKLEPVWSWDGIRDSVPAVQLGRARQDRKRAFSRRSSSEEEVLLTSELSGSV